MTAYDHLMNMIGKSFTLWMDGGVIADGELEFDRVFRIESIAFESCTVTRISGNDIHLL